MKSTSRMAFFRHQPDEHDHPDQGEDVQRLNGEGQGQEGSHDGHGDREEDDEGGGVGVVEGDHDQVDEEDRRRQGHEKVAESLLLHLYPLVTDVDRRG